MLLNILFVMNYFFVSGIALFCLVSTSSARDITHSLVILRPGYCSSFLEEKDFLYSFWISIISIWPVNYPIYLHFSQFLLVHWYLFSYVTSHCITNTSFHRNCLGYCIVLKGVSDICIHPRKTLQCTTFHGKCTV